MHMVCRDKLRKHTNEGKDSCMCVHTKEKRGKNIIDFKYPSILSFVANL